MTALHLVSILVVAYLAVFVECRFALPRNILGAQIDLLPPLMVYTGLTTDISTAALVATVSGLWLDSLSANPLGISLLPLACVALIAHGLRGALMRQDASTQFMVGLGASAAVPVLTLALLIADGQTPLYGGWFAWRWLTSALLSAAFTPLLFRLFDLLQHALNYQPEPSVSFRPDREIDRGRDPHAHF